MDRVRPIIPKNRVFSTRGSQTRSGTRRQASPNLARALVAAARNWTLYPPEHPAVPRVVRASGAGHSGRHQRRSVLDRHHARHPAGREAYRCRCEPAGHRGGAAAARPRSASADLLRRGASPRPCRSCCTCWPLDRETVRAAAAAREGVWREDGHRSIAARADRLRARPRGQRDEHQRPHARRRLAARSSTRSSTAPESDRRERAAAAAGNRRRPAQIGELAAP